MHLAVLSGHPSKFSAGPHLHFEVRANEAAIDPLPWLEAHGVTCYGRATGVNSAAHGGSPAED